MSNSVQLVPIHFERWVMTELLARWLQQWAQGLSLRLRGSPLASTSWSNSLIIDIYSAASAQRHVLMSPSYKMISIPSWRHQMESFSALLAIFMRGIHGSPVNSPHKGQWRGALVFSLICVWINGWVNNREAGDLRRYRAHYDVIVMPNLQLWGLRIDK